MTNQKSKAPGLLAILGGRLFARPVWLGRKLVCSRCFEVKKFSAFGDQADNRVEPVCLACRKGVDVDQGKTKERQ